MARYTPLPDFQRLITTHSSDGKAVFSSAIDETSKFKGVDNGNADFCLSYATSSFPVDMNNDADLERYKEYLVSPPGLVDSQGTVLRHVDIKPGFTSPMHRTVSLDYGIVLMGEVELILDSGEKKIMKAGDIAIQVGRNTQVLTTARRRGRLLMMNSAVQTMRGGTQVIRNGRG